MSVGDMSVLVYGCGAVGLYYASRFGEAGCAVTVMEPGRSSEPEKSEERREIVFEDGISGLEHRKTIRIVSPLPGDEEFSLLIVTLPGHLVERELERLEEIVSSGAVGRVLFLGGYVGDMEMWARSLAAGSTGTEKTGSESTGSENTLFAYPGVSAVFDREENRLLYCDREEGGGELRGITAGYLQGESSKLPEEVRELFAHAEIPLAESGNMKALYLSQAALRLPMTAAVLFAGGSLDSLSVRGDLLKLMIKGIREALATVRSLGYELSPSSLKLYRYVPPFIIANMMKGQFDTPSSRIGIEETALYAGGEPIYLAEQFLELNERSGVTNEHLGFLFSVFFDEEPE